MKKKLIKILKNILSVLEPPANKEINYKKINEKQKQELLKNIQDTSFLKKASDTKTVKINYAYSSNDGSYIVGGDNAPNNNKLYNIDSKANLYAISHFIQSSSFIGYNVCALLLQDAIINKACSVPAVEAVRKGWDIQSNSLDDELKSKVIKKLKKFDKKFKIKKELKNFSYYKRAFGIRIALFCIESKDPLYYEKPFNINGVTRGSFVGINQIDPYWAIPELTDTNLQDPTKPNFYKATFWNINGKRIHHTHLIVSEYTEIPDILKPTYEYSGIPLTQQLYEQVFRAEVSTKEAPKLLKTKRSKYQKINMKEALKDEIGFKEKQDFNQDMQDNYSTQFIDKSENVTQLQSTLTDVDGLIMTQWQMVAAIARIPITKLLETSPKGWQSSGSFEENSYFDLLESIQSDDFDPFLEKYYQILIRSELLHDYPELEDVDLSIEWESLVRLSEQDKASIHDTRVRSDVDLILNDIVSKNEVRDRISSSKFSNYNNLVGNMPPANDPDFENKE